MWLQRNVVHPGREVWQLSGKSWLQEGKLTDNIFMHKQETNRENRKWARIQTPKVHLQWPTSASKDCLLKVLEASQIAPPTGDQVFKYMSLSWVAFLFQTMTLLLSPSPTKDQSELESGSLFPQWLVLIDTCLCNGGQMVLPIQRRGIQATGPRWKVHSLYGFLYSVCYDGMVVTGVLDILPFFIQNVSYGDEFKRNQIQFCFSIKADCKYLLNKLYFLEQH